MRADSDGTRLTADLHGPTSVPYVLLLSLVSPAIGSPFGTLWISTADNLLLQAGTFDATRRATYQIAHPRAPGFTVTLQPVVFRTTFEVGSPAIVAFP